MRIMLILRKVLFYLFLGVYLVVCPIVILYSLGYIYAPKAQERIVKTGLVRLETLPSGASVFLNGKPFAEKTPCTVGELLPGRYQIQVRLDQRHPWTRFVEVEAGKAVAFEKILLLPKKFRSGVLIPQPFNALIRVPATRFLMLFKDENIGGVVVFDWKSGVFHRLLPATSVYAHSEIRRYFFSKGSPFVLFEVRDGGRSRYLWCGLKEGDSEPRDITTLFKQNDPDDVRWENGNPEYLFVFSKGRLDRIDLEKKTFESGFMEGLRGFGICRGKVYSLKGESLVRSNFGAPKGEADVIDSGRFLSGIFPGEEMFRLEFLTSERVLFIGEKGELIANLLPYRFLGEGLSGFLPDSGLKKILVWTKAEVGIFDLGKPVRAEELFERGPEIDWFWQNGGDIRQAYFIYGVSHAIVCDHDKVFISEIGPCPPAVQELARVREGTVPFYAERTGKLYYLDPRTGYLVSLEVLPEEKILERMVEGIERQPKPGETK